MAVYRALKTLSGKVARGELTRLEWLTSEQVATLEQVGAVARISPPILAELPGWEDRAALLVTIGIDDGEELLDIEATDLADMTAISAEDIAAWQEEMTALLVIPEDDGCGCN